MHETGSGNPYGVQGLRRRGRTPRRRASGTPRARYGTDAGPPARPHDVLGQTRLALDRSDGQQTLRRRSAALLCVRRLRLRQLSRVHSASKRQLTACHLGAHRVDSVLALFSQPHLWGDSAMHLPAPLLMRHAVLLLLAGTSLPRRRALPGAPTAALAHASNCRFSGSGPLSRAIGRQPFAAVSIRDPL